MIVLEDLFLFHQFELCSELVLRKLYQRKNNLMKKPCSDRCDMDLLTLINLYCLDVVFIEVFHIKALTFWCQNC